MQYKALWTLRDKLGLLDLGGVGQKKHTACCWARLANKLSGRCTRLDLNDLYLTAAFFGILLYVVVALYVKYGKRSMEGRRWTELRLSRTGESGAKLRKWRWCTFPLSVRRSTRLLLEPEH